MPDWGCLAAVKRVRICVAGKCPGAHKQACRLQHGHLLLANALLHEHSVPLLTLYGLAGTCLSGLFHLG